MAAVSRRKKPTLADFQDFNNELKARKDEVTAMLPAHISWEKFEASAMAAIKQNPDLLKCEPRTLFSAVEKSAIDGLIPDQREGVITSYRTKQRDGSWIDAAQWNPMAWGLRKRARELDDIIIQTNVVYENDTFEWDEGDDPRITHKPAPLNTELGKVIGAYAIFKDGDTILHREVMRRNEIDDVRSQSKSPDGLLWTKFFSEGCRKSVLRRGIKSVPCSESLETVVTRDDEFFEFDAKPAAKAGPAKRGAQRETVQGGGGPKDLPPTVDEVAGIDEVPDAETENPEPEEKPEPKKTRKAKPKAEEPAPEPVVDNETPDDDTQTDLSAADDTQTEPDPVPEEEPEQEEEPEPFTHANPENDPDGFLDEVTKMLGVCETKEQLEEIAQKVSRVKNLWPPDVAEIRKVYKAQLERLRG